MYLYIEFQESLDMYPILIEPSVRNSRMGFIFGKKETTRKKILNETRAAILLIKRLNEEHRRLY